MINIHWLDWFLPLLVMSTKCNLQLETMGVGMIERLSNNFNWKHDGMWGPNKQIRQGIAIFYFLFLCVGFPLHCLVVSSYLKVEKMKVFCNSPSPHNKCLKNNRFFVMGKFFWKKRGWEVNFVCTMNGRWKWLSRATLSSHQEASK